MQIYKLEPDLFLNNPVSVLSVPFVPVFIKLFYNVLIVFIYENFTKKRDKKDKKDIKHFTLTEIPENNTYTPNLTHYQCLHLFFP